MSEKMKMKIRIKIHKASRALTIRKRLSNGAAIETKKFQLDYDCKNNEKKKTFKLLLDAYINETKN